MRDAAGTDERTTDRIDDPPGSSARQAAMWGQRADDWAEVMEGPKGWGVPVYERILDLVRIGAGTRLLDAGCGAGRFCRIAADRGAEVSGLDATRPFIEIARERVPEANFEVGDLQAMPWPDGSFEVVTGFNSFFLADDMSAALAEARRVAAPGARLAITVFGRPERCDSTRLFQAMSRVGAEASGEQPAPESGDAPALHDEGVLSSLAREAGWFPDEEAYLAFEERYPDLETMARGMLAAPPGRRAVALAGEERAIAALRDAAPRRGSGSAEVVLREEARYLVATA